MRLHSIFGKSFGIKSKFTSILLVMAFIPLFVAGIYGIHHSTEALQDTTLAHLEFELSSKADDIEKFLRSIHRDAMFLSQTVVMKDILDARVPEGSGEFRRLRERLERVAHIISQTRPYYYQVRYINEKGHEVVRVDSDGSKSELVPFDKLQYKGDRYYFKEAMKYPADTCYVSPMDLNVEMGKVEEPPRLVVRVATPVFDGKGGKRGIIIINLYASHLIEQMQKLNIAKGGTTFLVNREGYYLSHPNTQKVDVSFNVGLTQRLSGDYSINMVEKILSGRQGTIKGASDIISYHPILTGDSVAKDYWVLALIYPKKAIFNSISKLRMVFYAIGLFAVLAATVVGIWMGRRFTRPIVELHKGVEWIAEGDFDHRLDIRTGDEIESLAHRFNSMTEKLKESRDRLQNWNESLQEEVRKRTRELEIERNKLESILMCASEGIVVANEEDRVIIMNPAAEAILGVRKDDMLGKGIMQCHRDQEKIKAVLNGENTISPRVVTASLGSKQLEISVAVMGSGKERLGSMMVMRDITERQRLTEERMDMEKQLFLADKLVSIGELSAGIAHEIGNPLAAIKTVIQSMDEVAPFIGEQKGYMERILTEINRLNHFIKTFSAFAHPRVNTSGRCDVTQVLNDVIFLVKNEAIKHSIIIENAEDEGMPEAVIDQDQLKQVFINLLINAIQAMPDGGKIRIRTSRADGNGIKVSISDTGPGIPKEDAERVFDPFFTTKPNGTGLGLSIVQRIIKEHNGDIRVRSEVGKGTTFDLILPVG